MSESNESVIGRPLDRVDGRLKVTGGARFAAEFKEPALAYAVMVQSTVPRGRVSRIDRSAAERTPGVLAVLTHENAPQLPEKGRAAIHPPAGRALSLLQEDAVHYNGQPIAVVVADSFERAVDAAALLRVTYEQQPPPMLDFDAAKPAQYPPKSLISGSVDKSWGDFQAGSDAAEVRIDAVYTTPMEHHNPMEPHATVARWDGEHLTLYDATQYISGVKETVAKTLGISPDNIHVINPFVGGGFGCKGSVWSHVVLCAMAAKRIGRPVQLVLARPQMFGPVGGRPMTEQHIVLAARRDGRLTALRHEVLSHTSEFEDFTEPCTQPTRALYACPNAVTTQRLVRLNVGTPTFQRAPGEATGTFAIETAMDELAYALAMDPLALRLVNYADTEPSSGKPWSSKRLRECYRAAAERFGWSRRTPAPLSMRDGDELVGWGMATATYPAHRMPASASARVLADGTAIVQSGTQDIGTGTYTVMTQVAAETLGIPVAKVRFELGDSAMPRAPVSGGSMTAASVAPAVQNACRALRARLTALASDDPASPLAGVDAQRIAIDDGVVFVRDDRSRHEPLAALVARQGAPIEASGDAKPGDEEKRYASRSWGAVFAEVRVDGQLGVIRVPRVVATYSVGRLLNAKTARSQLQGGIVWGVSLALFEHSLLDRRWGRFVNGNLADYHVPVNADIGAIDVTFVEENDIVFNPVGVRGIGEIGITGVAGALSNAVYHATGKRVRDLPITLDKLL
jgi:xanthine dehydrogenase YagR molybdenum-binding subunit